MKNINLIKVILIIFICQIGHAQQWMTSLDIAQKLALSQDKMLLMVWEENTKLPYPVLVNMDNGKRILIPDLFEDETISPLIWAHFVPVIVSEDAYENLYNGIDEKVSQNYKLKFNDDSIKIMDANGYILNTKASYEHFENISELIGSYALNTKFISSELRRYKSQPNFYNAFYLASKYLDLALFLNRTIRSEIIGLSELYLNEAEGYIESSKVDTKAPLVERSALLRIQKHLILNNPNKALRKLKRMDAESISNTNTSFVGFLYYTAYRLLKKEDGAKLWESKVSLVNLKKAQLIINLNTKAIGNIN